jgi:hypothetical protein
MGKGDYGNAPAEQINEAATTRGRRYGQCDRISHDVSGEPTGPNDQLPGDGKRSHQVPGRLEIGMKWLAPRSGQAERTEGD